MIRNPQKSKLMNKITSRKAHQGPMNQTTTAFQLKLNKKKGVASKSL